MTWGQLETPPPQDNESQKRLHRELTTMLDRSPELLKFLLLSVRSNTYRPGRTLDQVAYGEGQRSLARLLLQYGGKFHAQENEQENGEEG